MDIERLTALTTAYAEAQAAQMRESEKLIQTATAHKTQEAAFKAAQDNENAAKKLLDDFIRDHTKIEARAINTEWALD